MDFMQVNSMSKHNETFFSVVSLCFIVLPKVEPNETPRSKLRGISTKDISNNNAASSGVFTQ